MDSWYFKPTNRNRKHFLEGYTYRMQFSNFTRWIIFVAIGVVQSFLSGDMAQTSQHRFWIEHIENCAKRELTRDLTPCENQGRRREYVHVRYGIYLWARCLRILSYRLGYE